MKNLVAEEYVSTSGTKDPTLCKDPHARVPPNILPPVSTAGEFQWSMIMSENESDLQRTIYICFTKNLGTSILHEPSVWGFYFMANSEAHPLHRRARLSGLRVLWAPSYSELSNISSWKQCRQLSESQPPHSLSLRLKTIMRSFGLMDLLLGCSKHRNAKVSQKWLIVSMGDFIIFSN